MRIVDRRAIEAARKPCCELCGRRGPVEIHHVFSRGMGGGGRLDVHFNLISLCCQCHRAYHDGHISRERILQAVARRYGVKAEEIENQIRELRQG